MGACDDGQGSLTVGANTGEKVSPSRCRASETSGETGCASTALLVSDSLARECGTIPKVSMLAPFAFSPAAAGARVKGELAGLRAESTGDDPTLVRDGVLGINASE